jgi:hypothetical protein
MLTCFLHLVSVGQVFFFALQAGLTATVSSGAGSGGSNL